MSNDVRLIDANELKYIESDANAYSGEWNADYEKGFADCLNKVMTLPTIEAQPVKHGWWIDYEKLSGEKTMVDKEVKRIIDKLDNRLNQAFSDAVNDAQNYWNPRVAQDALQDAYNNVSRWIDEILNGEEEAQK